MPSLAGCVAADRFSSCRRHTLSTLFQSSVRPFAPSSFSNSDKMAILRFSLADFRHSRTLSAPQSSIPVRELSKTMLELSECFHCAPRSLHRCYPSTELASIILVCVVSTFSFPREIPRHYFRDVFLFHPLSPLPPLNVGFTKYVADIHVDVLKRRRDRGGLDPRVPKRGK